MEEKKQKKIFLIIIIILVIILTALLIFTYLSMQDNDDDDDKENNKKTSESSLVSLETKIQKIDSQSLLYSSVDNKTMVLEMPEYTDDSKKDKLDEIKDTIAEFIKKNEDLEGYSKLITITKIDSDGAKDYFYCINAYDLPDMSKREKETMTYVDFVSLTKDMYSNTSSTDTSKNTSSSTSTTPKGEDVVLSQGNYVVGEDIKPGRYDVSAIEGSEGNINVVGGSYHDILSDQPNNYGWEKTFKNLELKEGQTVEIKNGLKVQLQAK